MSIFLGAELNKAFESILSGVGDGVTEDATLGLGTPVLPPLPMHGGDRNRTSPFAFTGNKFEFRAVGSSASLSFPNTVLNTIVAEAIDELAGELEQTLAAGTAMPEAVMELVKASYLANKVVCFNGDNYSDAWHQEAERRGLSNLRTTPDALPWLVEHQTVQAFEGYGVLNERELQARFEVLAEQYATKLNIEGETAASIARTMILPAALRYLAELQAAGHKGLITQAETLLNELVDAVGELEARNAEPGDLGSLEHAKWMRDNTIPAMERVRAVADQLERVVADDLWPLPKYSEMLFIK